MEKLRIKLKFIIRPDISAMVSLWEIALMLGVIRKIKTKKYKGFKRKIGKRAIKETSNNLIKSADSKDKIKINKGIKIKKMNKNKLFP
jgi:hypothetical protein